MTFFKCCMTFFWMTLAESLNTHPQVYTHTHTHTHTHTPTHTLKAKQRQHTMETVNRRRSALLPDLVCAQSQPWQHDRSSTRNCWTVQLWNFSLLWSNRECFTLTRISWSDSVAAADILEKCLKCSEYCILSSSFALLIPFNKASQWLWVCPHSLERAQARTHTHRHTHTHTHTHSCP